jgi:hypothetical protein
MRPNPFLAAGLFLLHAISALSPYGRRQGQKSPLVDGAGVALEDGSSSSGSSDHQKHRSKFGLPKWQTAEGVAAPSTCFPKSVSGMPQTIFVTTTSQPYMYGSKSRNWENTIWGPDSGRNIKNKLWVYNENAWDKMHGRPELEEGFMPQVDCHLDVFDAAPGLMDLVSKKNHIDDVYQVQGVRGLSDDIMDGKALVRKLVAINHAASQLPDGALIVWVDVDTIVSSRPFDKRWYDFVMSRDITYISESLCRSELAGLKTIEDLPAFCVDYRVESGVMAIKLSPTIREFLHTALSWYDGRMLQLAKDCLTPSSLPEKCAGAKNMWRRNNIGLNDIYVLAQVLHDHKGLKHGWFANERWTCGGQYHKLDDGRNKGKEMPWLGQCQPCVNKAKGELVTPFYVDEYVGHRKGGVGLMAVQHTEWRTLKDETAETKKKMKTKDAEMAMPRRHGQEQDPRPACGDYRLTPDCVHSILCEDASLKTSELYPDYKKPAKFV